jgi:hypothetical protein
VGDNDRGERMTEKNTLAAAIETTVMTLLAANIHTCLPGRIETYEFKKQKATVKPLIKRKYVDDTVQELPVLTNVPVVFPRTKKSGITFPLIRGDGVLIVFSERALERWKSSGDDTEPGDSRKFDLSDGLAIPGLFSFADNNLASNNNDLEIHHNGFKIVIKKNGKIQLLGLGGTDLVKVIDDWMTQMHQTKVITGIGLQPFDPTSLAAMTLIQTELKKLLVT